MFSKLLYLFFGKNTSHSNQTAKNDRRLSSGLYGGNNRLRTSVSKSQSTSSRSHYVDPLSDAHIIHTTSVSSASSSSSSRSSCDSSYDSSSYSSDDSSGGSCD